MVIMDNGYVMNVVMEDNVYVIVTVMVVIKQYYNVNTCD